MCVIVENTAVLQYYSTTVQQVFSNTVHIVLQKYSIKVITTKNSRALHYYYTMNISPNLLYKKHY